MPSLPRVVIIGRANVGKSTLFNRLTKGPRALVSAIAHTTRDRKESECTWLGRRFLLIDTGGLDITPLDHIEMKVADQARAAMADADTILFVVDVKDGLQPADSEIATLLRASKKPVIVVANKADNMRTASQTVEFYSLGFDKPWPVSAKNGVGTGDLLDAVIDTVRTVEVKDDTSIMVSIVGKPNVGKSSLINALLGEERFIVHDQPYTTRDTNAVILTVNGERLTLLDTAGVRRRSKIDPSSIEASSVGQSLSSIHLADVIVLVTESQVPLTAQDRQLASLVSESKASIIIVGNKWDLVDDKNSQKTKKFEDYYKKELNFIDWAPVILMSAKDQTKLTKLKEQILAVYHERFRKIEPNAMSKFLARAIKRQKPVIGKGTRKPFISKIEQVGVNPPQFIVHIGANTSIRYSYLNYLQGQLRDKFGFVGTPLKMWIEKPRQ